jgi:tripartite-type tricarboxylate transporter receptor subunit TctC
MNAFSKKLLVALGLSVCMASTAIAQTFPEKTVRIVVPYPPGGFNDTLARISSDRLGKIWSQPVVV